MGSSMGVGHSSLLQIQFMGIEATKITNWFLTSSFRCKQKALGIFSRVPFGYRKKAEGTRIEFDKDERYHSPSNFDLLNHDSNRPSVKDIHTIGSIL